MRTKLRFLPDYPRSELTMLARRFAAKSASGKKLPWTTGQRALLFEIRSYPLPQELDDCVTRYQWVLFLVVGPLDCIKRTRFIQDLRASLMTALKGFQDVEVQPLSRRITQTFTSVLRLKFRVGSQAELVQQMTDPAFLKTLQHIAAVTERTLKDAESEETSVEA